MRRRRLFTLSGHALGLTLFNACGHANNIATSGFTLAVAASLKDVMQALDTAFGQQYPRPASVLQVAGSGTLAQQIVEGARVDMFASADRASMNIIVDAAIITATDIVRIATTDLVVIAHPSRAVTRLLDLATPGTKVVLADGTVPAGRYAQSALTNLTAAYGPDYATQVNTNVVSLETNVRAVLQKVRSGEADAGIVYTADIAKLSDDEIRAIPIPIEYSVEAEYVAAILPGAQGDILTFMAFIRSAVAQPIWQAYGFRA